MLRFLASTPKLIHVRGLEVIHGRGLGDPWQGTLGDGCRRPFVETDISEIYLVVNGKGKGRERE